MSVEILHGDCRELLATLPAESVQTCVTSPPYFGLRAYSTEPQTWGGNPDCIHEWNTERYYREGGNSTGSTLAFSEPGEANAQRLKDTRWRENTLCIACGAWYGELGGEPTPQMYVEHLVAVFREVRRVLHPSGTVWLNLGDSYFGSWGNYSGERRGAGEQREITVGSLPAPAWNGRERERPGATFKHSTLKPKDLMMIPHRVAIALQDDGWWVRQDLVWSKTAPMPESVTDRCTKSHEYVFLLAKSERYFFDADAIREPHADDWHARATTWREGNAKQQHRGSSYHDFSDAKPFQNPPNPLGRNKRSVWHLGPESLAMAHFAVMPSKLVEPCILAGTSARGCCPSCFAPWQRLVERTDEEDASARGSHFDSGKTGINGNGRAQAGPRYVKRPAGWEPTCSCDAGAPVPCTVLDPFAGSGTVLRVATKHRRHAVGIELNADYVALCHKRLASVPVTLPMEEAI